MCTVLCCQHNSSGSSYEVCVTNLCSHTILFNEICSGRVLVALAHLIYRHTPHRTLRPTKYPVPDCVNQVLCCWSIHDDSMGFQGSYRLYSVTAVQIFIVFTLESHDPMLFGINQVFTILCCFHWNINPKDNRNPINCFS